MSLNPAADFSAQRLELGRDAVDAIEVERLRRILGAKEPSAALLNLPTESLLEKLGILVKDGDWRLTVAGLLLVGKEELLHRNLPGHEAVYLHMKSAVEYDYRLDTHQPLLALLEGLHQTIAPHNRLLTLKLGLFHFEIPDFPEEVYREALLNAFTHRDYELPGPVYIRHFPDRLEVSSPGGFCGGVTPENIIGHEPVTRNQLLASVLQRIRLVERAGMGVKRMFHILVSYGKEPPSYEAAKEYVRVTIRSGRTEGGGATAPAGIDETFARFVVKQQQEGKELNLYDLLVLNYLKRHREIDLPEAMRILQRSENEVREALNSMTIRGLVEPFGQKKGRVYRLSKTVYTQLRKTVSYYLFRRAESAYAESTIIGYLEELPGPEDKRFITNEIVRTLLRVSPHQATYLLGNLVKKGKLALRGRGRGARYYKVRQLTVF